MKTRSLMHSLLSLLTAGMTAAATPAVALTTSSGYFEYIGALIVTGTETNCSKYNIFVGREYNVRIMPPSIGTNPTQFRFNVYDREYGEMVFYPAVPGANFTTAVQAAFGARGYGNISPFPQMLLTTKPASYTTSTIGVVYEGKIKNFVNTGAQTTGQCDISFRASGVLKP